MVRPSALPSRRRGRARKPVVLLKVGRSRLGAAAARSHTAALAGDDAVFDAVVRAHGALSRRATPRNWSMSCRPRRAASIHTRMRSGW
ncbi:MAG: hypothetical protein RML45_13675 [Acetobacteraceae bacterium]|nr:hypothetical protein [Acetobacteraceae bacterium]